MSVPTHHKELVEYIRGLSPGHFKATRYADDRGERAMIVAEFGPETKRIYTTVGMCDQTLKLPSGRFELAALGELAWLPNALVSSGYWLTDRVIEEWPLVCEDVVRQNVKSTYRHMAYVPSGYSHIVSFGAPVTWLLGIPITDADIGIGLREISERVAAVYPSWILNSNA